jgi:ADP-ribosyl-[dinitrogen reductase] hydrolase
MRIAPVIIPHLATPSAAMWADAILAGMITHNDYASNAFCAAFCGLLWQFLSLNQIPNPVDLLDMFCEVGLQVEGEKEYQPRFGSFKFSDTPCKSTTQRVMHAYRNGWDTLKACNEWGSGAYLLETMPSVLYILMVHGDDPEEAIIRAVNDTRDNDTVAAIVGAAVGALHGKAALPQRWLDGLLGRTGADDDGRIYELIDAAREKWDNSNFS